MTLLVAIFAQITRATGESGAATVIVAAAPPATPASASAPSLPTAPTDSLDAQRRKARDAQDASDLKTRQAQDDADNKELTRSETESDAREGLLNRQRNLLLNPNSARSLGGLTSSLNSQTSDVDENGAPVRTGGVDTAFLATLVEGYDDNVLQTLQDPTARIVHRQGSPFVGLDVIGILQDIGPRSEQDLRLELRGQHYTPLGGRGLNISDDGTINAGYQLRYQPGQDSNIGFYFGSTLSTLNSARQSDGTLFRIDPYSGQRTFTLSTARLTYEYMLSQTWRLGIGADGTLQTILYDEPIILQDGRQVIPRGLDYYAVGGDATLFHDFDFSNIGLIRARYQYIDSRLALDPATDPPKNTGPIDTHTLQVEVGLTHLFSSYVSESTAVGAVAATPLPADPDQRLIYSPVAQQTVTVFTPEVLAQAGVNYSYGSLNPRLGFGVSIGASATLAATPWPKSLPRLYFLLNGQASRSSLIASPAELSKLYVYAGSADVRYGLTDTFALMAGYNYRYTSVDNGEGIPALWRSIYFVGVTAYLSTQRTTPPLTNFLAPIQGG